jgi:isopenicillin N synthase-like dioxygenase
LTSGLPDAKEGLYLGSEDEDEGFFRGHNPLPTDEWGPVLRDWLAHMQRVALVLVDAMEKTLDTDLSFMRGRPTELFRVFHYPPVPEGPEYPWGVGEHTDYGFLTLLKGDDAAGLEVRVPGVGWIDVPPTPNTFVVNLGDMLARVSGGRFQSTPHRVRTQTGTTGRLSFPYFFDPALDSAVLGLPYREYLLSKVAAVFPDLFTSSSPLPTGQS